MDLIEKTTKATYLYKGKIINLRVDDVTLPNGEASTREYVEHRGGAGVLAVDDENYVYLVKQFRYPYGEEMLEIPAGKLEEGELPIVTASRELSEETGLQGTVEEFGLLYPTPGYTNERLYIYLATNLRQKEAHPDSGEYLTVVRISLAEAYGKVLKGEIKDAKTAYAILKYVNIKNK